MCLGGVEDLCARGERERAAYCEGENELDPTVARRSGHAEYVRAYATRRTTSIVILVLSGRVSRTWLRNVPKAELAPISVSRSHATLKANLMRHPMNIPNTVLNNTSAASKPDDLVELAPDSKSEATFDHAHNALHRIVISQLTTCSVIEGGQRIGLDFVGQAGEPVSIEMPFDQAASIVMTIPRLLSAALKMQTRDAQARYVFSVGKLVLRVGERSELSNPFLANSGRFRSCVRNFV